MKPWRLNRRAFLGGAGTAIALPLLEAMLPIKNAYSMSSPARMICYYVPNGIHMQSWTPNQQGDNYQMPSILAPLSSVRDKLLVLSGIENDPAKPDGAGDHASGTGSFITATHVRKTNGSDIRNGISVDQAAASVIGNQTRFASLELGIDGGGSAGGCDSGYSCAYARNISWSGPQTPKPKTTDPRIHFNRLFAGLDLELTDQEIIRRRELNESVLSYVMDDTRKLQQKLGVNDRAKLDEYFTAIEELERRLTTPEENEPSCSPPTAPDTNLTLEQRVKVMADMMAIAFECDLTRIQTFMLANSISNRVYSFLGINGGHHSISHHRGLQSNFDKLETINLWEIQQFAYLLEQLNSKTDATGTSLLDSSMVFFSSEISDGNSHSHTDMPILLAGGANGYFNTGRHLRYNSEPPVANLFMTMLDAMGTPVARFGDDSTGLMTNLKA